MFCLLKNCFNAVCNNLLLLSTTAFVEPNFHIVFNNMCNNNSKTQYIIYELIVTIDILLRHIDFIIMTIYRYLLYFFDGSVKTY